MQPLERLVRWFDVQGFTRKAQKLFDCRWRQFQQNGDVLGGFAVANPLQHFTLAFGHVTLRIGQGLNFEVHHVVDYGNFIAMLGTNFLNLVLRHAYLCPQRCRAFGAFGHAEEADRVSCGNILAQIEPDNDLFGVR
jgi:hypothetical protein